MKSLPPLLEVERKLIGTVLAHPRSYALCQDLDPSEFADPLAKLLWGNLKERDGKTSLESLLVDLSKKVVGAQRALDLVGGRPGLEGILAQAGDPSHVDTYTRVIREAGSERQFASLIRSIQEEKSPLGERIERLQDALGKIGTQQENPDGSFSQGVVGWLEEITWKKAHPNEVRGLRTGFRDLDADVLDGLEAPNVLVVASGTGEGKSIFTSQVAMQLAVRGNRGAIFGVEMSAKEVVGRLATGLAQVDSNSYRKDRLTPDEWERLHAQATHLRETVQPNLRYFGPGEFATIDDVARISRVLKKDGLDFVVVDYLQRVEASRFREDRTYELGDITSKLKALAARLDLVVIEVCQINRERLKSGGQPTLYSLAESSAIEKDADYVLGLWRPERYTQDPGLVQTWHNVCIAELLKGRFRDLSTCYLYFNGPQNRFADLDQATIRHLKTAQVQQALQKFLQGKERRTRS